MSVSLESRFDALVQQKDVDGLCDLFQKGQATGKFELWGTRQICVQGVEGSVSVWYVLHKLSCAFDADESIATRALCDRVLDLNTETEVASRAVVANDLHLCLCLFQEAVKALYYGFLDWKKPVEAFDIVKNLKFDQMRANYYQANGHALWWTKPLQF